MDIDAIEPGLDFMEVIEQEVGSCDALVALIGKQWLTITDASGRRRLDNPEDFVRLEIAAALARNIRVIPALVHAAPMPRTSDLPDALKSLARRNAIEMSDTRFHFDVDRLIVLLDKVLRAAEPAADEKGDVVIAPRPSTAPQPRKESSAARQPFEPEMIRIPAGEFLMGSDPQQDEEALYHEQPQHRLSLPDYYLAKTPVTHGQYSAFVLATGYKAPGGWTNGDPPRGREDHPVEEVSWYDARNYCQWLSQVTGKDYRLPSEAEWEKGARGTDGRIYPWGYQWDVTRCNVWENSLGWEYGLPRTTSVHAYPQGASHYGVLDMAGNVWEWTRSLWGKSEERPDYRYPYRPTDGREDLAAGPEEHRMVRGGAFYVHLVYARCAFRQSRFPLDRGLGTGFRVVVRLAT
jgi:formylglycine-generating enzyme required for sulfatase activity